MLFPITGGALWSIFQTTVTGGLWL